MLRSFIMAGHSKWNNIKNRKAAVDAKKSKIFTQMSQLIRSAVQSSGIGDPEKNPSLRLALDKARSVNMTNEAAQRAIKRALGKSESGASLDEVVYEGYGPGGAAFVILVKTDNKQRTAAEIRHLMDKAGGSLTGPGSTTFLFTKSGMQYEPAMLLELDEELSTKVLQLFDALEEHDDVEAVFVNIAVPDSHDELDGV